MSLDQNGVKGTCRELADTGNEEKIMSVKKTTQVLQLQCKMWAMQTWTFKCCFSMGQQGLSCGVAWEFPSQPACPRGTFVLSENGLTVVTQTTGVWILALVQRVIYELQSVGLMVY